jgi:hypothetical protein
VDLYLIPHAVYAIRIGTGKGVHGGAGAMVESW